MGEKERKLPTSYKIGFVIGFILLLIGGLFSHLGTTMYDAAPYSNPGLGQDYYDQREMGVILRFVGSIFYIIGGLVIALLALFLALNPRLIESETVRTGLLILTGLIILAFVLAWAGTALATGISLGT
ncbi:MAG: hypothetical protein Q6356_009805 [Candidatus Wukongarchaeota archaeon]|nr:hypothetical protein [Candidatus Wukongarchaeota archaeon]